MCVHRGEEGPLRRAEQTTSQPFKDDGLHVEVLPRQRRRAPRHGLGPRRRQPGPDFIDPFGVSAVSKDADDRASCSPKNRKASSEVLVNINVEAISRHGGCLQWGTDREPELKPSVKHDEGIELSDAFFGGDWWRQAVPRRPRPHRRCQQGRDGGRRRVPRDHQRRDRGVLAGGADPPVADRPDAVPVHPLLPTPGSRLQVRRRSSEGHCDLARGLPTEGPRGSPGPRGRTSRRCLAGTRSFEYNENDAKAREDAVEGRRRRSHRGQHPSSRRPTRHPGRASRSARTSRRSWATSCRWPDSPHSSQHGTTSPLPRLVRARDKSQTKNMWKALTSSSSDSAGQLRHLRPDCTVEVAPMSLRGSATPLLVEERHTRRRRSCRGCRAPSQDRVPGLEARIRRR